MGQSTDRQFGMMQDDGLTEGTKERCGHVDTGIQPLCLWDTLERHDIYGTGYEDTGEITEQTMCDRYQK